MKKHKKQKKQAQPQPKKPVATELPAVPERAPEQSIPEIFSLDLDALMQTETPAVEPVQAQAQETAPELVLPAAETAEAAAPAPAEPETELPELELPLEDVSGSAPELPAEELTLPEPELPTEDAPGSAPELPAEQLVLPELVLPDVPNGQPTELPPQPQPAARMVLPEFDAPTLQMELPDALVLPESRQEKKAPAASRFFLTEDKPEERTQPEKLPELPLAEQTPPAAETPKPEAPEKKAEADEDLYAAIDAILGRDPFAADHAPAAEPEPEPEPEPAPELEPEPAAEPESAPVPEAELPNVGPEVKPEPESAPTPKNEALTPKAAPAAAEEKPRHGLRALFSRRKQPEKPTTEAAEAMPEPETPTRDEPPAEKEPEPPAAEQPDAPVSEEQPEQAAPETDLYAAIDAILSRSIFDELTMETPVSDAPTPETPEEEAEAPEQPEEGPETVEEAPEPVEAIPEITEETPAEAPEPEETPEEVPEEIPAEAPEAEIAPEAPKEEPEKADKDLYAAIDAILSRSIFDELTMETPASDAPTPETPEEEAETPEQPETEPEITEEAPETVEALPAPAEETPDVPAEAPEEEADAPEEEPEQPRELSVLEQLLAIATPVELGKKSRPQSDGATDGGTPAPDISAPDASAPVIPAPAIPTPSAPRARRAERQRPAPRTKQPAPEEAPETAPAAEEPLDPEEQGPKLLPREARKPRERRRNPAPAPDVLHPEEAYRKYGKDFGPLGTRIAIVIFLTVLSVFFTLYSGLGWSFLPPVFSGGFTAYLLLVLMLISLFVGNKVWQDAWNGVLERRFSLDALLMLACFAVTVDTFFAAHVGRTPLCAVAQLLLCFSLWGKYDDFMARLTTLHVLRTVQNPVGIVEVQDLMKGHRGIARNEGDVEQFMKHFGQPPRAERTLGIYALIAALLSLALGVAVSISSKVELPWLWALMLLGSIPLAGFLGHARSFYRLSRRMDDSDAALCGWHGAALFGGKHTILVSDADLFPRGSLSLNGFKIFNGNPDRVIAYAAAAIHASQSALQPLFDELLEAHNGRHFAVDRFRFYEGGGVGAEISGEIVLVGSGEFMRRMGVHMGSGMKVQQAAYVSVGGELAGVFAIRYTAPEEVRRGLTAIGRNRHFKTTLITRCFLATPQFLNAKFNIPTNNVAYPGIKERLRLSETEHRGDEQGALLGDDSFGAFAEAAAGGRQLQSASKASLWLSLGSGIASFLLLTILGGLGAYTTASAVNLLLYLAAWAIPTVLLTGWAERY